MAKRSYRTFDSPFSCDKLHLAFDSGWLNSQVPCDTCSVYSYWLRVNILQPIMLSVPVSVSPFCVCVVCVCMCVYVYIKHCPADLTMELFDQLIPTEQKHASSCVHVCLCVCVCVCVCGTAFSIHTHVCVYRCVRYVSRICMVLSKGHKHREVANLYR